MTAPSGGERKIRSILARLAAVLLLAPGCQPNEDSTVKAPPNPVPRADLGRPVEPKPRGTDGGGVAKDISDVGKDLRKDLGGSPVIAPNTPTTTVTPAARPGTP
jgi:hypothetical protein